MVERTSDENLYPCSHVISYIKRLHTGYCGGCLKDVRKFKQYKLVKVSVSDIQVGYFRTDKERVKDYAKRLKEGELMPPVVLFRSEYGQYMSILDGEHRVQAARMAGIKVIDAFVGVEPRLPEPILEIRLCRDVYVDERAMLNPLDAIHGEWHYLSEANATAKAKWGTACGCKVQKPEITGPSVLCVLCLGDYLQT